MEERSYLPSMQNVYCLLPSILQTPRQMEAHEGNSYVRLARRGPGGRQLDKQVLRECTGKRSGKASLVGSRTRAD